MMISERTQARVEEMFSHRDFTVITLMDELCCTAMYSRALLSELSRKGIIEVKEAGPNKKGGYLYKLRTGGISRRFHFLGNDHTDEAKCPTTAIPKQHPLLASLFWGNVEQCKETLEKWKLPEEKKPLAWEARGVL